MNIKIVILIVIGLLIGGALVGSFYLLSTAEKQPVSVTLSETTEPTPTPVGTALFEDPSGFSFEYPSNVSVEAADDAEYSSLKLSADDYSGKMTIVVDATEFDSANEWLDDNNYDLDTAKGITLGDVEAVEVPDESGITTVAYDQGALFVIEVTFQADTDFWQEVYDRVVTSFAFILPEKEETAPATSGGGSTGGGIIFEGEEIIE